MNAAAPRFLYLHGFASGPNSTKGKKIAAHYANRGVVFDRLDLRKPSLEHLRLSEMTKTVKDAIGGPRDRAVIFGSSLGGLTASRVAEEDARVSALVLMAPAFRFIERWKQRLGEAGWNAWRDSGWLDIMDYAEGRPARVDFGFALDADAVDARSGGWPDVRVPTLIVHGKNDDVVDIELSRAFAQARRHVRLVEVDDGHELAASIDRITREADAFLAPYFRP